MKKYRSNINSPKVIKLLVILSLLLLGAVVIIQIRDDIFPVYTYIIIAPLLSLGVYTFLWVIAILMPITVKLEGIKCYNSKGLYKELYWSQIEVVTIIKLYGLPYAYIESESLAYPITVPLYLNKMKDFKETVYKYAGLENPLSKFLQNET